MVEKFEELLIKGNMEFQWKIKQETEDMKLISKKIPKYPVLILTCMDPRIDVHRIFQLKPGDVFVLRNAGNGFTDDVLRSILIAIHEYNVRNIIILGHIDCGMTKINLIQLGQKLSKPALARILRDGTNIQIELQKYFKTFIDEIQNIKIQVERIRKAPEIPSGILVTGMLYDVNSHWVFEYEKFSKYTLIENFMRNYKEFVEAKKYDFIDYIESIEGEIVGKKELQNYKDRMPESIEIEKDQIKNELINKASETIEISEILPEEQKSFKEFDELVEIVQKQLTSIPKIQIPKIIIPKVKVYIPEIYKKKED
ncbi:MAG: beta-class carbonic anhydrase [Promethearchaeota archaeon]